MAAAALSLNLATLPNEILTVIICHLSIADQYSLRQVSRHLKERVDEEMTRLRRTRPCLRMFDYVNRWISRVNKDQVRLALAGQSVLWLHVGMPTTWMPTKLFVYDLLGGDTPLHHPQTGELLRTFDNMEEAEYDPWRKQRIATFEFDGATRSSITFMRQRNAVGTFTDLLQSFNISWFCFGYTTPGRVVYSPCSPPCFLRRPEFDINLCYLNQDEAACSASWPDSKRESVKRHVHLMRNRGFGIFVPLEMFEYTSYDGQALLYLTPYFANNVDPIQ
jgi:hypothetical protein